jgi:hypothetical protein
MTQDMESSRLSPILWNPTDLLSLLGKWNRELRAPLSAPQSPYLEMATTGVINPRPQSCKVKISVYQIEARDGT